MAQDLSRVLPLYIEDEFQLLRHCVELAGRQVLDIGCGAGAMTRRIATEGGAGHVVGMDVDEQQLSLLARSPLPAGLVFEKGCAEDLRFADASFDCVTMFKSLHHVPVSLMADAFAQVHRVLRPGGVLFLSEPVYAGALNDVIKIFHDEGEVRAAAIRAIDQALSAGRFALQRHVDFQSPVAFSDFEDFRTRIMNVTHSHFVFTPERVSRIQQAYALHQAPGGARFMRPVRVDVLVRV
jgi:SAM-dependent methyltransferase